MHGFISEAAIEVFPQSDILWICYKCILIRLSNQIGIKELVLFYNRPFRFEMYDDTREPFVPSTAQIGKIPWKPHRHHGVMYMHDSDANKPEKQNL